MEARLRELVFGQLASMLATTMAITDAQLCGGPRPSSSPVKHALVVFQSLRGTCFRASAPTCKRGADSWRSMLYMSVCMCACTSCFVTNDSGYDLAAVHLQKNGCCDSFLGLAGFHLRRN